MNKQNLSALAVLLIACLAALAFQSWTDQTALERVNAIMSASSELESYRIEATGNMSMALESEEEIPEYLESVFKMYDSMEIYVLADYVLNPERFQIRLLEEVDMGGMAMEIEAYLDHDEMIVKYPVIGNYIHITIEDLQNIFSFELPDNFLNDFYALIPDMSSDAAIIMSKYLTEENVRYLEPVTLEHDGYRERLHAIEIKYDSEMLIQVYADLILSVLENEKGRALFESVIEANGEQIPGSLDSDLNELIQIVTDVKDPESEARQKLTNELGPILDQLDLTAVLGVNNLNMPKAMWMNFDMLMPVDDFDDSVQMRMSYDIEYTLSHFNAIDEIEMPEIDEDDMISIGELIERFGGY